ncbi:hypothetical protein OSTOST_02295, partial [Ostertagia ostertagi]
METSQTFVDPIQLREYRKKNNQSASDIASKFLITIQYQTNSDSVTVHGTFRCICPDGFIGEFCHITEEERSCEEDYCSSHGQGHYEDGSCDCKCDPQDWIGEHSVTVHGTFRCICPDGFIGEFCHITEEERSCEEDYCSSHGQGHYEDGSCDCKCDPQDWIGERCDIRSPCAAYSCMNASNCTLKEHPKENRVEAVCNCPSGTELVSTRIT